MNGKFSIIGSALLAFTGLLHGGSLADDLLFYMPCEKVANQPQGIEVSTSVRCVPGKFGKGFLIERRTINYANKENFTLGDGATLKGNNNTLTLGEEGFAALSLIKLQPKSNNCLSFNYRGEGKITITLDYGEESKVLGELTATKQAQHAEYLVVSPMDSATIKISSEKPVVLDKIMFDKNINFGNTFHPAGKMRMVDRITVPAKLYPVNSGSFICYIKAKWLKREKSSANLVLGIQGVLGAKKFFPRQISVWGGSLCNIVALTDKKNASVTLPLRELKDKLNDEWNFFVFNWGEKDGSFYNEVIINGKHRFSKTVPGKPMWSTAEFLIGYSNGAYLNGIIDEIALFKRPLTMEEAEKIFMCGKPIVEVLK